MKKIVLVLISFLLLLSLTACKENKQDTRKEDLAKAVELIENEAYQEAIEILEPLGDYENAKDVLWLAKMRIVEDYLLNMDCKSGYEYLDNQDNEFIASAGVYVEPLLRNLIASTYHELNDDLQIQYEYALNIAKRVDVLDEPSSKVLNIINNNYDLLMKWQNAHKLILYYDDSMNFNYEVALGQWKERDYSSLNVTGINILQGSVFPVENGLELDEKANEIFDLYQEMGSNLESIYLVNPVSSKEAHYNTFLNLYDTYQKLLDVYKSEYLPVMNELDDLVDSFFAE